MKVHICGIDIGKTVFHLVGLSKEGHIVTKKRFSRKQLLTYTVNMPTCLIGIEVHRRIRVRTLGYQQRPCVSAHPGKIRALQASL